MDLFKLLKQLKNIEPDRDFKERSRYLILETSGPRQKTVSGWLLHNLGNAAALALGSLLLLLMMGSFSAWTIFSPARLSALDPASLRAEAQAIDIQIQLTNLGYSLTSSTAGLNETTPATAAPQKTITINNQKLQITISSSSATGTISIDEALDRLSE